MVSLTLVRTGGVVPLILVWTEGRGFTDLGMDRAWSRCPW